MRGEGRSEMGDGGKSNVRDECRRTKVEAGERPGGDRVAGRESESRRGREL